MESVAFMLNNLILEKWCFLLPATDSIQPIYWSSELDTDGQVSRQPRKVRPGGNCNNRVWTKN